MFLCNNVLSCVWTCRCGRMPIFKVPLQKNATNFSILVGGGVQAILSLKNLIYWSWAVCNSQFAAHFLCSSFACGLSASSLAPWSQCVSLTGTVGKRNSVENLKKMDEETKGVWNRGMVTVVGVYGLDFIKMRWSCCELVELMGWLFTRTPLG